VTSPTGAVIRDILHRLADRFPCHVLLYPVPVQGKGAELKIAAAIEAFNRIDGQGGIPRPDLIIVARGGGSIEDLWCFNEEVVVRAAAASTIPLISAVGHETDTTLIDYAASRRAPTPTAAAEMAVPVASELRLRVQQSQMRMSQAVQRMLGHHARMLESMVRGLARPDRLLESPMQRLDEWSERLDRAKERSLQMRAMQLDQRTTSLMRFNPKNHYEMRQTQLMHLYDGMHRSIQQRLMHNQHKTDAVSRLLVRPDRLLAQSIQYTNECDVRLHRAWQQIWKGRFMQLQQRSQALLQCSPIMRYEMQHKNLYHTYDRIVRAMQQRMMQTQQRIELRADPHKMQQSAMRRVAMASVRFEATDRMLESLSHHNVLKRGFAYVTGESGQLLTHASSVLAQEHITLCMQDGEVTLAIPKSNPMD
jgi:exonuclease VII large subunit